LYRRVFSLNGPQGTAQKPFVQKCLPNVMAFSDGKSFDIIVAAAITSGFDLKQ
jgi:hypothetical protein